MAFVGRQLGGKDTKVAMLGREIAVISIKYSVKQEKKNVFQMGNADPYTEIVGRKEYEAEIVIFQSEFQAIIDSLPAGKDLLDIAPFPIVVVYLDEVTNVIITHILESCSFMEMSQEMKNDSDMMEASLPLRVGSIQWKVAA